MASRGNLSQKGQQLFLCHDGCHPERIFVRAGVVIFCAPLFQFYVPAYRRAKTSREIYTLFSYVDKSVIGRHAAPHLRIACFGGPTLEERPLLLAQSAIYDHRRVRRGLCRAYFFAGYPCFLPNTASDRLSSKASAPMVPRS